MKSHTLSPGYHWRDSGGQFVSEVEAPWNIRLPSPTLSSLNLLADILRNAEPVHELTG
jgi:hypothetical protein